MSVGRRKRRDGSFDAERAAALQGNDDIAVFAMHDLEQTAPNARRDIVEFNVPRTPVAQHRELGLQTGGEWAGG